MATAAPAKSNGYKAPAVITTPKTMRDTLEKARQQLANVLPKHLTPERVSQVVTTIMFRTPKLQECDQNSILASVVQAASLGLDLLPSMNEAFLIPRWNDKAKCLECQFQPGYQGLVKLARNSGEIASIQTRLVRQDDVFSVSYNPDLHFDHRPCLNSSSPVTHIYAVAKLQNGEHLIEVMTADEIEAVHMRSEGYKYAKSKGYTEQGPWATDWNEMGKKTVLKRLCKCLPRSLDLQSAIDADNRDYTAEPVAITRTASQATLSRSGQLAERLKPVEPEQPQEAIEVAAATPDDGQDPADYGGEDEPGSQG